MIAASAIGSFAGATLGGFLADAVGFNSINWMAAAAGGASVLLALLVLSPANRKLEKQPAAVSEGRSRDVPPSA